MTFKVFYQTFHTISQSQSLLPIMEKLHIIPSSCLQVSRPLTVVGFERHARQMSDLIGGVLSPGAELKDGQQTQQETADVHRSNSPVCHTETPDTETTIRASCTEQHQDPNLASYDCCGVTWSLRAGTRKQLNTFKLGKGRNHIKHATGCCVHCGQIKAIQNIFLDYNKHAHKKRDIN